MTTHEFSASALEAMEGACLYWKMRLASRQLCKHYDDALSENGLTIGQFGILANIELAGKSSVQQLATAMQMDQSAMSRGIKPLEERGWVTSTRDKEDKRSRLIYLTPAGAEKFDKSSSDWKAAQESVFELLGASEALALKHNLERIVDIMAVPDA